MVNVPKDLTVQMERPLPSCVPQVITVINRGWAQFQALARVVIIVKDTVTSIRMVQSVPLVTTALQEALLPFSVRRARRVTAHATLA